MPSVACRRWRGFAYAGVNAGRGASISRVPVWGDLRGKPLISKDLAGWGTWIRTKTGGVRVRCPTVRRSPKIFLARQYLGTENFQSTDCVFKSARKTSTPRRGLAQPFIAQYPGQSRGGRPNPRPSALAFLKPPPLEGAIIRSQRLSRMTSAHFCDAIFCQREICQMSENRKGDYLFVVMDNSRNRKLASGFACAVAQRQRGHWSTPIPPKTGSEFHVGSQLIPACAIQASLR